MVYIFNLTTVDSLNKDNTIAAHIMSMNTIQLKYSLKSWDMLKRNNNVMFYSRFLIFFILNKMNKTSIQINIYKLKWKRILYINIVPKSSWNVIQNVGQIYQNSLCIRQIPVSKWSITRKGDLCLMNWLINTLYINGLFLNELGVRHTSIKLYTQ